MLQQAHTQPCHWEHPLLACCSTDHHNPMLLQLLKDPGALLEGWQPLSCPAHGSVLFTALQLLLML